VLWLPGVEQVKASVVSEGQAAAYASITEKNRTFEH
jgi:hypothetical protein